MMRFSSGDQTFMKIQFKKQSIFTPISQEKMLIQTLDGLKYYKI